MSAEHITGDFEVSQVKSRVGEAGRCLRGLSTSLHTPYIILWLPVPRTEILKVLPLQGNNCLQFPIAGKHKPRSGSAGNATMAATTSEQLAVADPAETCETLRPRAHRKAESREARGRTLKSQAASGKKNKSKDWPLGQRNYTPTYHRTNTGHCKTLRLPAAIAANRFPAQAGTKSDQPWLKDPARLLGPATRMNTRTSFPIAIALSNKQSPIKSLETTAAFFTLSAWVVVNVDRLGHR